MKCPRKAQSLLCGLPRVGMLEDVSTLLTSMGPKLLL